jgi:hypothetical protein
MSETGKLEAAYNRMVTKCDHLEQQTAVAKERIAELEAWHKTDVQTIHRNTTVIDRQLNTIDQQAAEIAALREQVGRMPVVLGYANPVSVKARETHGGSLGHVVKKPNREFSVAIYIDPPAGKE